MRIHINSETVRLLDQVAERYHRDPSVVGRAIVHTVLSEGITDEILAGVDLDEPIGRRKRNKGMWAFRGEKLSLPAISDITGVPPNVISRRLSFGWSLEKAATHPVRPTRFRRTMQEARP